MKLKVKNFDWLAGRPVVILNNKTAKKINVFQGDRVCIQNSKKFYSIVDIFPKLVNEKEIGLSTELTKLLDIKQGSLVDISPAPMSSASVLIKKKINGKTLTEKEYSTIIEEIVTNNLTEAEIAYFIAAQKMQKMTTNESISLTKAMVKQGEKLKFDSKYVADKHCIGGIAGNRTTPIVTSICAAAGLIMPKSSSRAITSAAGTADVIETLSNVEISLSELKQIVNKHNACLVWGGSLGLSPSDDKIIQVERLLNLDVESQLLASIMSKKISAGSKYILIDIPYGPGGKIHSITQAKSLGNKFKQIASAFNVKIKIAYTNGNQPIGNGIGPVLEMLDVLKVLKNEPTAPKDLKEKSLHLASDLLTLCGEKNSYKKAKEILTSGKAYEKFKNIINAQNKSNDFDKRVEELKLAPYKKTIKSWENKKIIKIDNKKINTLCRILGSPETIGSGVYLHKHLGKISAKQDLITLYSASKQKIKEAEDYYKKEKPITLK
ncbi:MAG: thymidine phosphorylase [Candidatus Nanoarchaeia archaeon]|jgi:putative thymidine phosphorylase|nr:thymidine phosphorylase [Candidatus Nanoarchaeia archaeon]MDD3993981.1 thymidine phosphorylase [Candidatus Nanoarchaeia archaeon]MDD4563311.1 thymidine phosphorylase [Candidatus Nanoarchaeia archaeon]